MRGVWINAFSRVNAVASRQVEDINNRFGVDIASKQTADVARLYGIYLESIIPKGDAPLTGAHVSPAEARWGCSSTCVRACMQRQMPRWPLSRQSGNYCTPVVHGRALFLHGVTFLCAKCPLGARRDGAGQSACLQGGGRSLGRGRGAGASGRWAPPRALLIRGRLPGGQRLGEEGAPCWAQPASSARQQRCGMQACPELKSTELAAVFGTSSAEGGNCDTLLTELCTGPGGADLSCQPSSIKTAPTSPAGPALV